MKNSLVSFREAYHLSFISKLTLTLILVLSMLSFVNAQNNETAPPEITDFVLNPSTIDTTDDSQTVTLTIQAKDAQRGVGLIQIVFRSTEFTNQRVVIGVDSRHLISGDNREGVYRAPIVFPQYSKAGTWEVFVIRVYSSVDEYYKDFDKSALAARGLATELQVVSRDEDISPPELVDFSITPSVIDMTNSTPRSTVTVRVKDAKAGVKGISIGFHVPNANGGYDYSRASYPLYLEASKRVSGDSKDGVYQTTTSFSQHTYQGVYAISVILNDNLDNNTLLYPNELAERGFTSQFQIINRSQLITFSIYGRVLGANGRGVSRAMVTLTESNGTVKYAMTSSFGYYRFTNIAFGGTGLRVRYRSRTFNIRTLWVDRPMSNVNFTEIPATEN